MTLYYQQWLLQGNINSIILVILSQSYNHITLLCGHLCATFLLTMPTGYITYRPKVLVNSLCPNDDSTYSLTISLGSNIEYIRPNPSPVFYFFLTTYAFSARFTRFMKANQMVMIITVQHSYLLIHIMLSVYKFFFNIPLAYFHLSITACDTPKCDAARR